MNEILLFLLLGLGTGATIAAIAVGIVVTYRGSGFINLAAGAIAMLAGFSFWALRTGELGFTVSTPLAVVLSYVFVLVASVAIELAVFRPLRTAAPLAKLVASLGVLLTLQAVMLLAFGTSQHPQPTIIPVRVDPHAGVGRAAVRLRAERDRGRDDGPVVGRSTAGRASGSRRAQRPRTTWPPASRASRPTSCRS